MIEIASHNSAGIQAEAARIGATHMRLIATGDMNGVKASLYAIPTEHGEIRVLDTNGDPVWEELDLAIFAEMLREYGIDVE